jgi:hypothetical protein
MRHSLVTMESWHTSRGRDTQRGESLPLPDLPKLSMIVGAAFPYDSFGMHNDTTEVMDA